MAPFFWDRDRGETRVVTVGGSCGMSEAYAAGLSGFGGQGAAGCMAMR